MRWGFVGMDVSPEGYRRNLELQLEQSKLMLAREKEKPEPDQLAIAKHESGVKCYALLLEDFEQKRKEYAHPEERFKSELAAFRDMLGAGKKVRKSEVEAKLRFKDNYAQAVFFALVKKRGGVKVSREFVLFGQEIFERA